jgi:hypothetical protein
MNKESLSKTDLLRIVAERRAQTHTEFRPGEPEVARLLLDRLPPEMIVAAKVLLDVLHSQELDGKLWKSNTQSHENLSPARAGLIAIAEDLLYRSFWFAEDNMLSPEELMAIFQLSGIHDQHLINPVAQSIHKNPRNWTDWEKGYQDQVYRRYTGPDWVINELDIQFTPTDLHLMYFYMLNETGELLEDRSIRYSNKLKLSPKLKRKLSQ